MEKCDRRLNVSTVGAEIILSPCTVESREPEFHINI
jgi:hypothetical protein